MRISLHNHSNRCDGECTPEEIVWAAIEGGLSHVAITDHLDSEKLRPFVGITPETMSDYVAEVRDLAARYADRIAVLAGVEIDFNRERTAFDSFDTPELASELLGGLDLVLFEYVQDSKWDGEDLATFSDLRRNISLPVGLAHPDLLATFSGLSPEAAAGMLAEHNVFLELCPSPRNAVLDLADDLHREQFEEDALRLDDEYQMVLEEFGKDPGNEDLLKRMDELHVKLAELQSQELWVPSYRVSDPFIKGFFHAVRQRGVLLSIGTDSHGHWEEVNAIDDAVDFIVKNDLTDNLITAHLWQR
ncbi:MAG: PHP domain-containing protein [Planctomycetota bacterium]